MRSEVDRDLSFRCSNRAVLVVRGFKYIAFILYDSKMNHIGFSIACHFKNNFNRIN